MKKTIEILAPKMGYCFATKQIVDNKQRVGYMYREVPDDKYDSGWRFFMGTETDEYANNPDNLAIYDVNTIANLDQAIIPYLESPYGKEFERLENNTFKEIEEL